MKKLEKHITILDGKDYEGFHYNEIAEAVNQLIEAREFDLKRIELLENALHGLIELSPEIKALLTPTKP